MLDLRDFWDFGDARRSRDRFEKLLTETAEPSLCFEIRCQIARTHSLERNFDTCHECLDALEPQLEGADARGRASYYLERGRAFNTSGDKARANEQFLLALPSGEDDLVVDAMHMLAIAAIDPETAEAWNERALALSGSSEHPWARRWRGSLLNNLAWTYHDTGRAAQALRLFEEAIALRTAAGSAEQVRIAKWCYARCLRTLERLEEALAIQQALVTEGEDGYVSEELGELLLALGRSQDAKPYFAQAHSLLSQDVGLQTEQPQRLARLQKLAT